MLNNILWNYFVNRKEIAIFIEMENPLTLIVDHKLLGKH